MNKEQNEPDELNNLLYTLHTTPLMDHIGLDLVKMIMERPINSHAGHNRLIDNLVKEGKFGRKTGEGFYKY